MSNYVKTVSIGVKGSDMFSATFDFDDGTDVDNHGYAPDIKNVCGGDYLNIKVDNATGKIIGWVPVEADDVEALLKAM